MIFLRMTRRISGGGHCAALLGVSSRRIRFEERGNENNFMRDVVRLFGFGYRAERIGTAILVVHIYTAISTT